MSDRLISTASMVQDVRLRRLFAASGLVLIDALLDAELQEALLNSLLELAPEFVPPYCGDPEDDEAWEELVDEALPGVREGSEEKKP